MSGAGETEADVPRLPEGARDVLAVERAELAAIEAGLRSAFASYGYREVRTPLLEFADVMDRAQDGGVGRAFRLFDDHGDVLVLRPDLTIPIARLVATRLATHPGPVRVSYVAPAMRPALPGRAQAVEERQAGIELVGLGGPAADAEVVGLVVTALRDLGVADLRVGLGDVGLTQAVLEGLGVDEASQVRLRDAARARNLVAWRTVAQTLPLDEGSRRRVIDLPALRGDAGVLDELGGAVPAAAPACAALSQMLTLLDEYGVADAVMVDLGVLRDWGYYSGIVFEAYAPGVGKPVAVGGRYDTLGGRFGADRPAVGFGVVLDALHQAIAARNGGQALADGVVLAGGLESEVSLAQRIRGAGIAVVALPDGVDPEALAAADGWRFVARPAPGGLIVDDRAHGDRVECSDIMEVLESRRS